jgi:hypothetical protein
MLLGPHCSHVTESVASVTSYWNIVQVIFIPFHFISHLKKKKSIQSFSPLTRF